MFLCYVQWFIGVMFLCYVQWFEMRGHSSFC
jgi:hypothetical protein